MKLQIRSKVVLLVVGLTVAAFHFIDGGTLQSERSWVDAVNTNHDTVDHDTALINNANDVTRQRANRTRRASPAENFNTQSAFFVLNALGTLLSTVFPVAGSLVLITSSLISTLYTVFGEPQHVAPSLSLATYQRARMVGYRDYLKSIESRARTDEAVSLRTLETLHGILTTDRCLFMHTDDNEARNSVVYFTEFATMHITVTQMLILHNPTDYHWQDVMSDILLKYVRYGYFIRRKFDLPSRLRETMQKWILQTPDQTLQRGLRRLDSVEYNEAVSFRMGYDQWLSCWWSGYNCQKATCPGRNNPMRAGPDYEYWYACRGEIFRIRPYRRYQKFNSVDVHVCDVVYMFYSTMRGSTWHLSRADGRGSLGLNTKSCPVYSSSNCIEERWEILVQGKECGALINDHDNISLRNTAYGKLRHPGYWQIFRSDMSQSSYEGTDPCTSSPTGR